VAEWEPPVELRELVAEWEPLVELWKLVAEWEPLVELWKLVASTQQQYVSHLRALAVVCQVAPLWGLQA
jgi:hypothetical protein